MTTLAFARKHGSPAQQVAFRLSFLTRGVILLAIWGCVLLADALLA